MSTKGQEGLTSYPTWVACPHTHATSFSAQSLDYTLSEGTVIDETAFAVTKIDGSRGACLFGTIAAFLGDGTPEGVCASVASFARRQPHARVRLGTQLWKVSQLTALLAETTPRAYARQLTREGVWGDTIALAIASRLSPLARGRTGG